MLLYHRRPRSQGRLVTVTLINFVKGRLQHTIGSLLFQMKKSLITITLLVLCATVSVTILLHHSERQRNLKNGFKRKFAGHTLIKQDSLRNIFLAGWLAGYDSQRIYFQTLEPSSLVSCTRKLKSIQNVDIALNKKDSFLPGFQTTMNRGQIKIFDKKLKKLIVYNLEHNSINRFNFNGHITQGLPGPGNLLFLRSDAEINGLQTFKKINLSTHHISYENSVSDTIPDGGISSNGMLLFSPCTYHLYYVHYFSNNIIEMDTNLNLISIWHTIDTFLSSTVLSHKQKAEHKTTYTTSNVPKFVNGLSTISGRFLLINSLVRADNEKSNRFDNNSVIDIYTLVDGSYLGSFYIPKYRERKMMSFWLDKHLLIVCYKNAVITYTFEPDLLGLITKSE